MLILDCPNCKSSHYKNNGSVRGKRKNQCLDCGRQYILEPKKKTISKKTWDLVDKLLLEKLSLSGISRVVGISEKSLQTYVNKKFENIDQTVLVMEKKR